MIDHTRHSGIFNVEHLMVTLIGAGGIGALTAITLGKMGIEVMEIFDDDTVDDVNIATQFHRLSDIGKNKATSVSNQVEMFSGISPIWNDRRFDETLPSEHFAHPADIYISAVDSIGSRKGIWEAINKNLLTSGKGNVNKWYIDARMGAEVFEMFVVHLARPMWYEDHICKANDDDYIDLPCTSKATIYTADIAAGHIGATVRRIATLDQVPGFLSHDIVANELYFQKMNL